MFLLCKILGSNRHTSQFKVWRLDRNEVLLKTANQLTRLLRTLLAQRTYVSLCHAFIPHFLHVINHQSTFFFINLFILSYPLDTIYPPTTT